MILFVLPTKKCHNISTLDHLQHKKPYLQQKMLLFTTTFKHLDFEHRKIIYNKKILQQEMLYLQQNLKFSHLQQHLNTWILNVEFTTEKC